MPITTCCAPDWALCADRFVEHRHEGVDAFDREALHAHVRASEEPLQTVDFGQTLEQRLLLVVGERLGRVARLDHVAEPLALAVLAKVLEFVRDRAAVELAHPLDDVGRGAVLVAERGRRNLGEIRFRDAVELRLQLDGTGACRAERIDLDREVAVTLNVADERRGGSGFLEKRSVDAAGY